MRDCLELLLGVAGTGCDDGATERMRARLHDERTRREMIRIAIVHDVARAETRGKQRARCAPKILAFALRLEDRPRRHQQPPQAPGRRDIEAAEGRRLFLAPYELGFAQQRQLGERGSRGHGIRIDASKLGRPSRGTHRERKEIGQLAEKVTLARIGIAQLKRIVVLVTHGLAPFRVMRGQKRVEDARERAYNPRSHLLRKAF